MFQTQWLFLTLRVVRSEGVLFLVLKTLRVVRQWSSPLSGHASLSFHMIHKFPGTIFSASSYWISLINCNNILISIKKDAEHISVGTRYFPTTQINDPNKRSYTYIANIRHHRPEFCNIFENTRGLVLMLGMSAFGNFIFSCIFCVYSSVN